MNIPKLPADVIMLISAGIDSFIQWRLLGQPTAIYFPLDNRAQNNESAKISLIRKDFGGDIIVNTDLNCLGFYEMSNGYVPYRNLLFLMFASLVSPNVIIAQISEWAPDKNEKFYRHTEKLLREATSGSFQGIDMKTKIFSPFSHMTKTQLVREYLKKWPAEDLTKYTVSCYSGEDVNCGKCNACMSRYVAMRNNQVDEAYAEVPDLSSFKSKLSIRDFRLSNLMMYLRRFKEYKEYNEFKRKR